MTFNIKIFSRRKTTVSLLGIIKQHPPSVWQTTCCFHAASGHLRNCKVIRNLGSGFLQSLFKFSIPPTHPPLEVWTGGCQENSVPPGWLGQKQSYLSRDHAAVHQCHPAIGFLILFLQTHPRVLFTCQKGTSDGFELNVYHWFFSRKRQAPLCTEGHRVCMSNDLKANAFHPRTF